MSGPHGWGHARVVVLVMFIAASAVASAVTGCSSGATPPRPPAPTPSPPPRDPEPVPDPGPPYTGPANLGPCASDDDCRALDDCGCACRPLRRGVSVGPSACEETCPGDGCAGKHPHCNPESRQCEVAPDAAPAPSPAPEPSPAPAPAPAPGPPRIRVSPAASS